MRRSIMMNSCRGLLVFILSFLMIENGTAVAQSLSADSDKPIEITADTLEVFQEQSQAVFTGNVEAVQGTILLKSSEMRVYYRGEGGGGDNQISRIDVNGNVFLKAPNETAQGDKGIYDVDKSVLHLMGNVLLTQDKNVIKGQQLVYDLKTGKSRIVSGNGGASSGDSSTGGNGRVKGVFFPQKKQE